MKQPNYVPQLLIKNNNVNYYFIDVVGNTLDSVITINKNGTLNLGETLLGNPIVATNGQSNDLNISNYTFEPNTFKLEKPALDAQIFLIKATLKINNFTSVTITHTSGATLTVNNASTVYSYYYFIITGTNKTQYYIQVNGTAYPLYKSSDFSVETGTLWGLQSNHGFDGTPDGKNIKITSLLPDNGIWYLLDNYPLHDTNNQRYIWTLAASDIP